MNIEELTFGELQEFYQITKRPKHHFNLIMKAELLSKALEWCLYYDSSFIKQLLNKNVEELMPKEDDEERDEKEKEREKNIIELLKREIKNIQTKHKLQIHDIEKIRDVCIAEFTEKLSDYGDLEQMQLAVDYLFIKRSNSSFTLKDAQKLTPAELTELVSQSETKKKE